MPQHPLPQIQPFFPESRGNTQKFLTTFSHAEMEAAQNLWDAYSGAKGLLRASRDGKTGSRYVYDSTKMRYSQARAGNQRNRVLTDADLLLYVRRVSNAQKQAMRKLTAQLIAGTLILSVWYHQMRDMLKSLYYTVWLLGIGGALFDDTTQRNLFYLFVLSQFTHMDNFAMQLSTGVEGYTGRALTRAGAYAAWGNVQHQNMKLNFGISNGFTEARRVLGDNENHCHNSSDRPGCIELAARGFVPIEQLVPIGNATCWNECHCSVEIRRGVR